MTIQPTPAEFETADAIMKYLETSEVELAPTRDSLARIIATHRIANQVTTGKSNTKCTCWLNDDTPSIHHLPPCPLA